MGESFEFDFDRLVEEASSEPRTIEEMEQKGLEQQFMEESERGALRDERERQNREEKLRKDMERYPEYYNKPDDEKGLFGTALREKQTAKRKQAELANTMEELENNDPQEVQEPDITFSVPRTPSPPRSPRPPSPPPIISNKRNRPRVNDWTVKYTQEFSKSIVVMWNVLTFAERNMRISRCKTASYRTSSSKLSQRIPCGRAYRRQDDLSPA